MFPYIQKFFNIENLKNLLIHSIFYQLSWIIYFEIGSFSSMLCAGASLTIYLVSDATSRIIKFLYPSSPINIEQERACFAELKERFDNIDIPFEHLFKSNWELLQIMKNDLQNNLNLYSLTDYVKDRMQRVESFENYVKLGDRISLFDTINKIENIKSIFKPIFIYNSIVVLTKEILWPSKTVKKYSSQNEHDFEEKSSDATISGEMVAGSLTDAIISAEIASGSVTEVQHITKKEDSYHVLTAKEPKENKILLQSTASKEHEQKTIDSLFCPVELPYSVHEEAPIGCVNTALFQHL